MLKGKAKIDYQREYMRNRRKNGVVRPPGVRPINIVSLVGCDDFKEAHYNTEEVFSVTWVDADGNRVYND